MSRFTSLAISVIVLLIGLAFAHAQQQPDKSAKAEEKDPTLIKTIPLGEDVKVAYWSGDRSIMTTTSVRKKKDSDDTESPRFKTVKIWDARTGNLLHSLGELEFPGFLRQHLSHDGTTLVVHQDFFGGAEELEVWDTSRAAIIRRIPLELSRRYASRVVLSPDGKLVAVLVWDSRGIIPKEQRSGTVELFDATTGNKLQTLREDKGCPISAVFTPDGKTLLTRGSNDLIRLWDLQKGKVIRERQASNRSAFEMALSPDGRTLIIPGALQVWDVPSLKLKKEIATPFRFVSKAEFSPDGKLLALTGPKQEWDKAKADRYYGIIVCDFEKNQMLREWDPGVEWSAFIDNDTMALLDSGNIKIHRIKR